MIISLQMGIHFQSTVISSVQKYYIQNIMMEANVSLEQVGTQNFGDIITMKI